MNTTIAQTAAWVATIGFIGMTCFQTLLALGFPLGQVAWGGKYEKLPPGLRVGSLLSAGIFAFGTLCVLERVDILAVLDQPTVVKYAVWILAALFGLSTLANLASSSKWEKRIMTPIALTLSLTCLIVAIASCSNAPTPTPTQEPLLRQIDEAEKQWQEREIQSYRIEVLTVRGTWHAQYHEITVRNGQVVAESASCTPAPAELGKCEVEPFDAQDFTVPALFAQARTQAQIGPQDQIRITYDPGYGFPNLISRSQPEITDGGVVWRVEAFEALE